MTFQGCGVADVGLLIESQARAGTIAPFGPRELSFVSVLVHSPDSEGLTSCRCGVHRVTWGPSGPPPGMLRDPAASP